MSATTVLVIIGTFAGVELCVILALIQTLREAGRTIRRYEEEVQAGPLASDYIRRVTSQVVPVTTGTSEGLVVTRELAEDNDLDIMQLIRDAGIPVDGERQYSTTVLPPKFDNPERLIENTDIYDGLPGYDDDES